MNDSHSQNSGSIDSWNAAPSRAAGLYGELQPLPLPVPAPVSPAMASKPRPKAAVTGQVPQGLAKRPVVSRSCRYAATMW